MDKEKIYDALLKSSPEDIEEILKNVGKDLKDIVFDEKVLPDAVQSMVKGRIESVKAFGKALVEMAPDVVKAIEAIQKTKALLENQDELNQIIAQITQNMDEFERKSYKNDLLKALVSFDMASIADLTKDVPPEQVEQLLREGGNAMKAVATATNTSLSTGEFKDLNKNTRDFIAHSSKAVEGIGNQLINAAPMIGKTMRVARILTTQGTQGKNLLVESKLRIQQVTGLLGVVEQVLNTVKEQKDDLSLDKKSLKEKIAEKVRDLPAIRRNIKDLEALANDSDELLKKIQDPYIKGLLDQAGIKEADLKNVKKIGLSIIKEALKNLDRIEAGITVANILLAKGRNLVAELNQKIARAKVLEQEINQLLSKLESVEPEAKEFLLEEISKKSGALNAVKSDLEELKILVRDVVKFAKEADSEPIKLAMKSLGITKNDVRSLTARAEELSKGGIDAALKGLETVEAGVMVANIALAQGRDLQTQLKEKQSKAKALVAEISKIQEDLKSVKIEVDKQRLLGQLAAKAGELVGARRDLESLKTLVQNSDQVLNHLKDSMIQTLIEKAGIEESKVRDVVIKAKAFGTQGIDTVLQGLEQAEAAVAVANLYMAKGKELQEQLKEKQKQATALVTDITELQKQLLDKANDPAMKEMVLRQLSAKAGDLIAARVDLEGLKTLAQNSDQLLKHMEDAAVKNLMDKAGIEPEAVRAAVAKAQALGTDGVNKALQGLEQAEAVVAVANVYMAKGKELQAQLEQKKKQAEVLVKDITELQQQLIEKANDPAIKEMVLRQLSAKAGELVAARADLEGLKALAGNSDQILNHLEDEVVKNLMDKAGIEPEAVRAAVAKAQALGTEGVNKALQGLEQAEAVVAVANVYMAKGKELQAQLEQKKKQAEVLVKDITELQQQLIEKANDPAIKEMVLRQLSAKAGDLITARVDLEGLKTLAQNSDQILNHLEDEVVKNLMDKAGIKPEAVQAAVAKAQALGTEGVNTVLQGLEQAEAAVAVANLYMAKGKGLQEQLEQKKKQAEVLVKDITELQQQLIEKANDPAIKEMVLRQLSAKAGDLITARVDLEGLKTLAQNSDQILNHLEDEVVKNLMDKAGIKPEAVQAAVAKTQALGTEGVNKALQGLEQAEAAVVVANLYMAKGKELQEQLKEKQKQATALVTDITELQKKLIKPAIDPAIQESILKQLSAKAGELVATRADLEGLKTLARNSDQVLNHLEDEVVKNLMDKAGIKPEAVQAAVVKAQALGTEGVNKALQGLEQAEAAVAVANLYMAKGKELQEQLKEKQKQATALVTDITELQKKLIKPAIDPAIQESILKQLSAKAGELVATRADLEGLKTLARNSDQVLNHLEDEVVKNLMDKAGIKPEAVQAAVAKAQALGTEGVNKALQGLEQAEAAVAVANLYMAKGKELQEQLKEKQKQATALVADITELQKKLIKPAIDPAIQESILKQLSAKAGELVATRADLEGLKTLARNSDQVLNHLEDEVVKNLMDKAGIKPEAVQAAVAKAQALGTEGVNKALQGLEQAEAVVAVANLYIAKGKNLEKVLERKIAEAKKLQEEVDEIAKRLDFAKVGEGSHKLIEQLAAKADVLIFVKDDLESLKALAQNSEQVLNHLKDPVVAELMKKADISVDVVKDIATKAEKLVSHSIDIALQGLEEAEAVVEMADLSLSQGKKLGEEVVAKIVEAHRLEQEISGLLTRFSQAKNELTNNDLMRKLADNDAQLEQVRQELLGLRNLSREGKKVMGHLGEAALEKAMNRAHLERGKLEELATDAQNIGETLVNEALDEIDRSENDIELIAGVLFKDDPSDEEIAAAERLAGKSKDEKFSETPPSSTPMLLSHKVRQKKKEKKDKEDIEPGDDKKLKL